MRGKTLKKKENVENITQTTGFFRKFPSSAERWQSSSLSLCLFVNNAPREYTRASEMDPADFSVCSIAEKI